MQTALNKEASLGDITLQEDAQGNIDIDIGDDIPDEWLDAFVERYSLQSLTLHVGPFNLEGSGIKLYLNLRSKAILLLI